MPDVRLGNNLFYTERKVIVNNSGESLIKRISSVIIRSRFIIFAVFAVFAVYCALSVGKTRVNSDIKNFLPPETETRRGIVIMEQQFKTYSSTNIMVSGVDYEAACDLADGIERIEGVFDVTFNDSYDRFHDGNALFTLNFEYSDGDPAINTSLEEAKRMLSGYEYYISSGLTGYSQQLAKEMVSVLLIAAVVIIAVLLFTSKSYFEVIIFIIVFVFAALFNMGTNYWLGEISSITNSIAIILQLALAIDYAIIFAHRYQDESDACADGREALVNALSKSIVEIASSSLTTVSGLMALTLMQFRLGYDLGLVLTKGIVFSMLTVFLLMPGLITLFPKALKKTKHRPLVPNITKWGKLLMNSKYAFVFVFALIIPLSVFLSSNVTYAFSDKNVSQIIYSESRSASARIDETFKPNTSIVVLVPSGDYKKEKALLEDIASLEKVKAAVGLASVKLNDGLYLTDELKPADFSELFGVGIEDSKLLFKGYAISRGEFKYLYTDTADYSAPLADVLLFLFKQIDKGNVTLDESRAALISTQRRTLERAAEQLSGEDYDRLLVTSSLPTEGEQSVALVENIRVASEKYYGKGYTLIVGDITVAKELSDSFGSDSALVSVLTILFVFAILLITFKSPVMAAILVFVIQGSIWMNFSFSYIFDIRSSFVTYIIVSAIQMGATIDYAIVLSSRYRSLRGQYDKKTAMAAAVNECFPTVITSGTIMTVAGLVIGFRVSDVYVGHIGLAVGRGALISVILVLTVLPQLIVLCDKAIRASTFKLKRAERGENKGNTDYDGI